MSVIELNSENFKTEVEESDIPVLVDFFADWCGPCQMMKPVFEELSSDYEGKIKFAKLNTEAASDVAAKWDIRSIPCLVLIEKGAEKDRIMGFMPKEALKEKIDSIK